MTMLIGTFCRLGHRVWVTWEPGPRKLGGKGQEGGALQSFRLDSAPCLYSCVLAELIHLPRFTKRLVGYSGCQALRAQGCVSEAGV